MKIEEKVIKVICESLEVGPDAINEDTAIGDIPEWSSLGHIILISSLEQEFGITFDPEQIMDLEDVSDIIAAIEERVNNQ